MEETNLWLSAVVRSCNAGETKTALEAAKELRKAALRAAESRLGKSASKDSKRDRRRSRSPRRRDRSASRSDISDDEARSRRKKRPDETERKGRRSPSLSDDDFDREVAPRKGQAQLTKKRPANADSDAESEYSDQPEPSNQARLRSFAEVVKDPKECSQLGDWDPMRLFIFRVLLDNLRTPRSLKSGLPLRTAMDMIRAELARSQMGGMSPSNIKSYISTLWRVFDIDSHTKRMIVPEVLWMRGRVPILAALLELKAYFVFDLPNLTVASALTRRCNGKAQHMKAIESYLLKAFPELSPDAAGMILNLALDPNLGFLRETSRGGMAFLKPAPMLLLSEMLAWLRESYSGDAWPLALFKGRWRTWSKFDAKFDTILDAAEQEGYIKRMKIPRSSNVGIQYIPDRVWQEAWRHR